MKRDDPAPLVAPRDLVAAAALLTRLPLPAMEAQHHRGAACAWTYPLIGAALGAAAAGIGALTLTLNLPLLAAAVLTLATPVLLTGALHEDGLADTADGLWGGQDRETRLKIMRDHQLGTYGSLALIFILLLKLSALTTLVASSNWGAIIAAAALSRAAMPVLMWALPHARDDGLSALTGRPSQATMALALAFGCAITLIATGAAALAALPLAALIATLLTLRAKSLIGGQTGDILGASQNLTETISLLTFAALLA